jgi:hypothetical protein
MSEENFLKRWSRRKREIAKEEAQQTPAPDARAQSSAPVPEKPEPAFDPASLPPLESITELTDITAFLRQGVPADLARAALRRVWAADPSIRDFVGLAENAWDFTDPNAMPGFGPLEMTEDVRRMIARVVGEIGQSAQLAMSDAAARAEHEENSNYSNTIITDSSDTAPVSEEQPKQISAQNVGNPAIRQVVPPASKEDIAPQHDPAEAHEKPKQIPHRGHGGALPR